MYEVEVTREGDAWLAEVVNLDGAHTWAKNLQQLEKNVAEVIRLVEDIPDDVPLDHMHMHFSNATERFRAAAEIGHEREWLEAKQRELMAATAIAARNLADEGWSVRDIGGALRVTAGRVSQILAGSIPENDESAPAASR